MAEAASFVTGAGTPDEPKIFNARKNLENELEFELLKMEKKLDRIGDKASDLLKARVLDARYRYEYVSEALGPDSPAKQAAREAEQAANYEAALQQLTENMKLAKNLQQVMKYVAQASKNTSPLPGLLAETKDTEDILSVLKLTYGDKGNADYARRLAKDILASTNADEVAAAFSKIALEEATKDIQDLEELNKKKSENNARKFVSSYAMRLGEIKSTFIEEAGAATTED